MTKRKDFTFIAFLVLWDIWNEKNVPVIQHKQAPPLVILEKIKRVNRSFRF
jgi:hypothetical protein